MQTIEKILCSEPHGIISFVGAGGKTSLMFHLANLLLISGQRVLTTTTTKMFVPPPEQSETLLVESDIKTLLRQASSCRKCSGHVTAAFDYIPENGKLLGFKPDDIIAFKESGLFDWILVEADGAAGRSLKAPAEHEPVIPSVTTLVVAVAGLDVIGKPLSGDNVFRSDIVARVTGLAENEPVTESVVARLIADPGGFLKGAPPSSRRFIFLNKADNPEKIAAGGRIAQKLRQIGGAIAAEAIIVGQALDRITVHAVHQPGRSK